MFPTHSTRPRLHLLEDRDTPSCLVYALQDTLYILGDNADNVVGLIAQGSRVSVTCDNTPAGTFDGIRQIVTALDDGDDRVTVARPAQPVGIPPAPLAWHLNAGRGDDVANLEWVPGASDSIWVDLESGNDLFDAQFLPPTPLQPSPVEFLVTVRGGAGLDRITSRMGVEPTPFAPPIDCTLTLDGGAGNDVLDAAFESDPTQQKVADLHVALIGGAGDDTLRLTWTPGIAFDVDATADGGAGFDVGEFSPGVRHVNVERLG